MHYPNIKTPPLPCADDDDFLCASDSVYYVRYVIIAFTSSLFLLFVLGINETLDYLTWNFCISVCVLFKPYILHFRLIHGFAAISVLSSLSLFYSFY